MPRNFPLDSCLAVKAVDWQGKIMGWLHSFRDFRARQKAADYGEADEILCSHGSKLLLDGRHRERNITSM